MHFVPLMVLGALVWKLVDLLKHLNARDWNSVVTQLIVWIAGVGAVVLFGFTSFAGMIPVMDGMSLAQLGLLEQVIIGLSATSLMGVAYDAKKAVDNTDSAAQPKLTNL